MKTYFSSCANLQFASGRPRREIVDGETRIYEPPMVVFNQTGKENFGMLMTDDPEIIAACDKRMKEVGDIFDENEYLRRSTPPEVREANALAENKRLLNEKNELLRKLAAIEAETAAGRQARAAR